MSLDAADLIAGGSLTHEVEVPADLLPANGPTPAPGQVRLRPLTVRDLQRIGKAAREEDGLTAALMIHQALVEPELGLDEVSRMPAGLARYLVEQVNRISGITTPRDALDEHVQAPLAKACFVVAKEFGWTPEEVSGMTVGQILLYVQMTREQGER
jgi:hypothetical protein